MALQLEKDLNNGFTADYWRVTEIRIDILEKRMSFQVVLYKDKVSRDNNLSYITSVPYTLDNAAYDSLLLAPNVIVGIYNLLKLQPEFAGSIDC